MTIKRRHLTPKTNTTPNKKVAAKSVPNAIAQFRRVFNNPTFTGWIPADDLVHEETTPHVVYDAEPDEQPGAFTEAMHQMIRNMLVARYENSPQNPQAREEVLTFARTYLSDMFGLSIVGRCAEVDVSESVYTPESDPNTDAHEDEETPNDVHSETTEAATGEEGNSATGESESDSPPDFEVSGSC